MNAVSDPTGTAEARAMLEQLPELYFSVLKNAHVEQRSGEEVHCSFELPILGKRTKTAPTALQAIRAALLDLTNVLTSTPPDEWPDGWGREALRSSAAAQHIPEGDKSDRFQAKARQFTIGVTMPVSLKKSLQDIAEQQQASFAEVARKLIGAGFEDFYELSYSEGSENLFALLSSEVRTWQPSNTEQVMVRMDLNLAVRLRSAAKEYRRSASEFGVMCLAHGFVLQAQFVEIERKVAAYRGAAVRKLAPQVGLGNQAALLSGILAGTICAPTRVLQGLSEILDAPQRMLAEFFKRSFEVRVLPSFKAENRKPQVVCVVTSWNEAVESLNLPAEQEEELLQLDASGT